MLKADQAGLFVDTTRAILRAGRGTITRLRARLSMGKYASTATNMIFLYPPSLRPGAADAGEAILSGDMSLGCAPAAIGPLPTHLFTGKVPHENWARAAYGFDWLCDLIATDHRDAFTFSLQSILHFCRARLDRQSPARQPDIIGRRLLRWNLFIAQYRDDISVVDRTFILGHVQRDVRLLAQLLETSAEGYPRFEAAMGQALTALWLDNCIDLLRPAMDMLGKEFRRQILADGGPANRAPETLLNLLADTRALMAALSEREIDAPSFMDELLPRMENMLMFLTLSDGALAQFQGGNMSRAPKVAARRPAGQAKIGFNLPSSSIAVTCPAARWPAKLI